MILNWCTTKRDAWLIQGIVQRAEALVVATGSGFDRLAATMDIVACHLNGNPLRLEEFFQADDFNFLHDFGGIRRHIDRESGQLRDCFVPRFSQPRKALAKP